MRPLSNSKTQIAGVYDTIYSGKLGHKRPVSVAAWRDEDGTPQMQRFFWDEWGGRAGAHAEAKLFREEMVREVVLALHRRGVEVVIIK